MTMKCKKILALFLALLIIVGIFAGCSSKSGNAFSGAAPEAAPDDGIYGNSSGTSSVITDRKLIRRVSLDAETENMDTLLNAIDSKITELGGYVENRSVRSGSRYGGREQSRYANLTIRIPAERLDEFVSHMSDVSNVTSTSEASEDVTLSYVATESRMKALQAEEERLLALIDSAANLSELLELEKRLTDVRTELEKVTSQLKLYDNLVDYGTVNLSINEVTQYTPTEEPTFWERISTGFTGSVKNLGVILRELVIFFVCALPYLVPMGAVAGIVLLIIKAVGKKKKENNPPQQTPNS
jgi:hypothetical protein